MVVRELVTIIGFRVNNSELLRAENAFRRLRVQGEGLAMVGRNMALFLTLPLALMARGAIKAGVENERLRASFTALMGDAKKANTFVSQLYSFIAKSPLLTLKEAAPAAFRLMAVGQVPVDQIMPMMHQLGIIRAATGVSMSRLIYDFAHTLSMQYMDARHLRMLTMAGVPIVDPLLKELGMKKGPDAVDKLMKLASQRKISSEVLKRAVASLTGPGGLYGNIEASMTNTLWGRWQIFEDRMQIFAMLMGEKVAPALHKILEAMSNFAGALANIDPNIARFTWMLGGLLAIAAPLALAIKYLAGPMGIIIGVLTIVAGIIDDIYVWTQHGDSIMGILFGDYDKYKPAIELLKKDVLNLVTQLGAALVALVMALADLSKTTLKGGALPEFVNLLIAAVRLINDTVAGLHALSIWAVTPLVGRTEEEKKKKWENWNKIDDLVHSTYLFGSPDSNKTAVAATWSGDVVIHSTGVLDADRAKEFGAQTAHEVSVAFQKGFDHLFHKELKRARSDYVPEEGFN